MVSAAQLNTAVRSSQPAPRLSLVPRPVGPASDYVGLVRKVAYSMARRLPSRVDVRDLISSGTLGLLDAIAKYDPKQNDNFEAYAEIRVRGAILDELRGLDWVPRSVRQKSHALDETTRIGIHKAPYAANLGDRHFTAGNAPGLSQCQAWVDPVGPTYNPRHRSVICLIPNLERSNLLTINHYHHPGLYRCPIWCLNVVGLSNIRSPRDLQ